MSKNKKNTQPKAPPLSRRLMEGLIQAETLLDQHKPAEASQLLAELAARHPDQPDVLTLQINASYDLQDYISYEWSAYCLAKLKRNLPDVFIGLGGAYLEMHRPALALRNFEQFLQRWPAHPRSAEIRQTVDELRTSLLAEIRQPGLSEAEILELAAGHDEVRFLMLHHQLRQCKQVAEKLLKAHPELTPVMNNLTQVHLIEGNHAEARRLSQAVLKIDPENIHALANLSRLLYLDGDFPAAGEMAQRMTASPSQVPERKAKLAEVYSLLEDDQNLFALYAQAEQSGDLEASLENALMLHHSAVALARDGREPQSRDLWEKALKAVPSFELARENLEDLDLPDGQRNGPWAYRLSDWVSAQVKQDMVAALRVPVKRKNGVETENATRQLLQKNPALVVLLPQMLARGDVVTRQFVIRLIKMAEAPELIALLKNFALGNRGTDEIRLDAMQFLSRQGHLPSGSQRMWIKGKWSEILQLNFEITSDPAPDFKSPATGKLALQAVEALRAQDGAHAQALIEKALEAEQTPSLINNLALALEMQGQTERAHEIAESIHVRFPDYFFGITTAARQAIVRGDLDQAHTLLSGLSQRKRLHVTEFDALCEAEIHLGLARENLEVARSWQKMWEKVNPEDSRLEKYRLMLSEPKMLLNMMRQSLRK
jgi:tetratricopeptide (TPR) repeat protein